MFYKIIFINLNKLAFLVKPYSANLANKIENYAIEFEKAINNGNPIEKYLLVEMEDRLFGDYGWINELNNAPFSDDERLRFNEIVDALTTEFRKI